MTDDLAVWLLSVIAEDERRAQAAAPGGWEYCEDDADGEIISDDSPHYSVAFARSGNPRAGIDGMAAQNGTGSHIATWQPKRVLAECDAKRQVIEALQRQAACDCDSFGHHLAVGDMLEVLALTYADRPGYRESWRP